MLVKTTLKNDLKAIFDALKDYDGSAGQSQDEAIDKLATDLANAIDSYIKSATITSVPALTSPSGPVTGTITNTIS